MGVKNDILQIEDWEVDEFFVGATIRHSKMNFRWDFLTIYGPANHDLSEEFILSLSRRCENANLPLVIGGDFNLIRTLDDKSTKTGSEKLMKLFNDFIEKFDLRDLHRGGGKFTWTNKQTNPIQSNIDRVLVSTEWEEKYPMATLSALTRIGSDHTPLLLDDEEQRIQRQRQFFFEKQWCKEDNFLQVIESKWNSVKER